MRSMILCNAKSRRLEFSCSKLNNYKESRRLERYDECSRMSRLTAYFAKKSSKITKTMLSIREVECYETGK